MNSEARKARDKRIRAMFQEMGSIRGTARRLKVDRHIVRRVLSGESSNPAAPTKVPVRPSKLDPFRAQIRRLVLEDGLSGVLVMERVRETGYGGGYSLLKAYIRTIRPGKQKRATTRLEHPPGAEGQVDWSPYTVTLGGVSVIVQVFSMVLPFSAYRVMRVSLDTKLETLLSLHEEAFEVLGGYPAQMTFDNMTTVGRHISKDELWLNPVFDAYRERCGFDVHLIDPGSPTQHGSVERAFHYFEHNCLPRRQSTFESLEDMQAHVKEWCKEVANVRIHGTTRERPVDRFQREKGLLLPLISTRAETGRTYSRTVGTDFCVSLATNRYSVPPRHVGLPATLFVQGTTLVVRINGSVVACHALHPERYQRVVLPEHDQEFRKSSRSEKLLEQMFLRLGPVGEDYYQGLRTSRGRGAHFHVTRLLKLCDRYGIEKVTGAMSHAARYGNYSADAVVRVLSGRGIEPVIPQQEAGTPPPPDRVRRWLEGLDVERGDLRHYDRLLNPLEDDREGGDE